MTPAEIAEAASLTEAWKARDECQDLVRDDWRYMDTYEEQVAGWDLMGLASYNWDGLDSGHFIDQNRAVPACREAAEAFSQDARILFRYGKSLEDKHPQESARIYIDGAKMGHASAQARLSLAYTRGKGVPRDLTEAARWLREAADQGHSAAAFELARRYRHGTGVMQDYIEAYRWFTVAAILGRRSAQEYRQKLVSHMTPEEVEWAERLAQKWEPRS